MPKPDPRADPCSSAPDPVFDPPLAGCSAVDGAPSSSDSSASAGVRSIASSQEAAPYAEALGAHARGKRLMAMVPGHGEDPTIAGRHLAALLGDEAVRLDAPMMLNGIDLGPGSPLDEALALAARAWGATRTWFLTNGASQGNRAAALAVRGLGERVLVQRNSHSSFVDGIVQAGLLPAFLAPSIDRVRGIAHGVSPRALAAALRGEREAGRAAAAVYLVSPSYFGSTADVEGLAAVAHAEGAALVVDGAWGAHFGFHPDLPESPLRQGADLVVSSTHKLGGSLSQSAMLHLGEGPFAERLEPFVERAYDMTASTSMSTLLLASLDLARRALALGEETISRTLDRVRDARRRLREDERFEIVSDGFGGFADIVATDELRLPIDVSRLGRSGHWVRERLRVDHGVFLEMSTATTVVAAFGALAVPDAGLLVDALRKTADAADRRRQTDLGIAPAAFPSIPNPGPLRLPPRDAVFAHSELVPANEAVGRISADSLAAYPPGIPNLLPGEEVTSEAVDFLRAVAASPTGYVRGAADPGVNRLRVVAGD